MSSAVNRQSFVIAVVLQKALKGDPGLQILCWFFDCCIFFCVVVIVIVSTTITAVPMRTFVAKADGAVGALDAQQDQISGSRGYPQLVIVPQGLAQDHLSLRILRGQVRECRCVLSHCQ